MNFTINSNTFAKAIAIISKAQSSKNALPILDCILIETVGDKVRLTASDAENYLSCELETNEHDGEMRIALNAKQLHNGIKEICDQPITFETTSGSEVIIHYLNGKYSLTSGEAGTYPENQLRPTESISFTVDSETLRDGFNHCCWALPSKFDELRPQMSGIYFDVLKDGFTMVGTDGHKLARSQFLNPEQIEGASFIILPKAIKILQSMMGGTLSNVQTVSVSVAKDKSVATFYAGAYTFSTRLVDKKFPNYRSVIPTDLPFNAVVNIQDLRAVVVRILAFASAESSLLKFRFADNQLTVSAQDIDFSTSAEEKMVVEYNATPISIGFSGDILKQLLSEMPGENVRISMIDPQRAAILTPEDKGESNEDILMLVMPMMLNE